MSPEDRSGTATIRRLAIALAGEYGMPPDRALAFVRCVFRAIRDDLESADRVVIPGVLVIERLPQGATRRHRVRFVLHKRASSAAAIRRWRAGRAGST